MAKPDKKSADHRAPDQDAAVEKAFQEAKLPEADRRTVKVRAKERGYYGGTGVHQLREPGEVFDAQLAEGEELPLWMELVEDADATGDSK